MEVVASKFPSMRVRIIQKDNLYYFAEIKKGQTFDIEDCGEQNWEEVCIKVQTHLNIYVIYFKNILPQLVLR